MSIAATTVVTPAGQTPVTLSAAKAQVRVTHTAEDELFAQYIASATAWAETFTGRKLLDTVLRYRMDDFPDNGESVGEADLYSRVGRKPSPYSPLARRLSRTARDSAILLPGGRVSAVESIAYVDTDGVTQTLTGPTSGTPGADYQEDLTHDSYAYVFPLANGYWPSTDDDTVNTVTLEYTAGFGSEPDDVPADIRHAILMRIADQYQFRAGSDGKSKFATAAEHLLEPWRVELY